MLRAGGVGVAGVIFFLGGNDGEFLLGDDPPDARR
jgi:hypothetical protein